MLVPFTCALTCAPHLACVFLNTGIYLSSLDGPDLQTEASKEQNQGEGQEIQIGTLFVWPML